MFHELICSQLVHVSLDSFADTLMVHLTLNCPEDGYLLFLRDPLGQKIVNNRSQVNRKVNWPSVLMLSFVPKTEGTQSYVIFNSFCFTRSLLVMWPTYAGPATSFFRTGICQIMTLEPNLPWFSFMFILCFSRHTFFQRFLAHFNPDNEENIIIRAL
jgi:hypothetical protein